ncbi:putative transferase [Helianthus annuus]|uniref:Transferase n=1 Tax=Helianthus annuus TaxID=4232 RepID=A0A9K3EE49_HELAN|nr:putative transferase [Helianthus annuus]KAJ0496104.1 putative transferase [Helianthus annuus]
MYFTLLEVLDLGENKFSGNIPEWIGEIKLIALRLHKNNFTGRIPHSLCKSFRLQILDLAHNNLRGSIPHCFGWHDEELGY